MKIPVICLVLFFAPGFQQVCGQLKWQNVDSLYAPLPAGFHVFKSTDSLDGKPNISFYVSADLNNKKLNFTTDTTYRRRLTPWKFYEKNGKPLLVVNGTFFSFDTHQNLNLVIKDGKILAHNVNKMTIQKGDTSVLQDQYATKGVFGIDKKRKADINWVKSDSSNRYAYEFYQPPSLLSTADSLAVVNKNLWKMQTAIGGGPVLVQEGRVFIAHSPVKTPAGKINMDKHPRTCIGYTKDGKLIILVIQGRFPDLAEGATFEQEAKILVDLGCIEALNLDGGGSSCLLINGKETIKPSDKGFQRPVPAVFLVKFR